jgi:hypothetical protein
MYRRCYDSNVLSFVAGPAAIPIVNKNNKQKIFNDNYRTARTKKCILRIRDIISNITSKGRFHAHSRSFSTRRRLNMRVFTWLKYLLRVVLIPNGVRVISGKRAGQFLQYVVSVLTMRLTCD